jgi:hypothetical protein
VLDARGLGGGGHWGPQEGEVDGGGGVAKGGRGGWRAGSLPGGRDGGC